LPTWICGIQAVDRLGCSVFPTALALVHHGPRCSWLLCLLLCDLLSFLAATWCSGLSPAVGSAHTPGRLRSGTQASTQSPVPCSARYSWFRPSATRLSASRVPWKWKPTPATMECWFRSKTGLRSSCSALPAPASHQVPLLPLTRPDNDEHPVFGCCRVSSLCRTRCACRQLHEHRYRLSVRRIYDLLALYQNYFQPSRRLVSKT